MLFYIKCKLYKTRYINQWSVTILFFYWHSISHFTKIFLSWLIRNFSRFNIILYYYNIIGMLRIKFSALIYFYLLLPHLLHQSSSLSVLTSGSQSAPLSVAPEILIEREIIRFNSNLFTMSVLTLSYVLSELQVNNIQRRISSVIVLSAIKIFQYSDKPLFP